MKFTAPSDTVSVMPRQYVMLQFMVDNLENLIIDTKDAGTETPVKVTYTEADGCKRNGGFTFNIVGKSRICYF